MDDVAAVTHEAVLDAREGGVWRRAKGFVVGVVGAALGDPTAVEGDLVVRRRDDHAELLRLTDLDESEALQLLQEARKDLDALPLAEFEARWAPVDD